MFSGFSSREDGPPSQSAMLLRSSQATMSGYRLLDARACAAARVTPGSGPWDDSLLDSLTVRPFGLPGTYGGIEERSARIMSHSLVLMRFCAVVGAAVGCV